MYSPIGYRECTDEQFLARYRLHRTRVESRFTLFVRIMSTFPKGRPTLSAGTGKPIKMPELTKDMQLRICENLGREVWRELWPHDARQVVDYMNGAWRPLTRRLFEEDLRDYVNKTMHWAWWRWEWEEWAWEQWHVVQWNFSGSSEQSIAMAA